MNNRDAHAKINLIINPVIWQLFLNLLNESIFVCKLDTDLKSLIENIFWNFYVIEKWIFQHVLNLHFVIFPICA